MDASKIYEQIHRTASIVNAIPTPQKTVVICYPTVFDKIIAEAEAEAEDMLDGVEVCIKEPKIFGMSIYSCAYLKEHHIASLSQEQYERLIAAEKVYDVIIKNDEQREECKRELYRKVFGYTD